VGLVDEAFATEAGEEAAYGLSRKAGHAAELLMSELHQEGDGEIAMGGAVVEVAHACPVKEGAGEFTCGGGAESEAARGEQGAVVLASEGQSGGTANVGVGFHEADEVGAGDGFDSAGTKGFGGEAVEGVFAQSGEAEDVPGAGDAKQEEAAIGRGSGDFDAATADDQEMVGGKAFADEDCVGVSMTTDPDGMEVAQDGARERAGVVERGGRSVRSGNGKFCKTAWEDGGPPKTQRESSLRRLILHGNAELCCTRLNIVQGKDEYREGARPGVEAAW